MFPPPRQGEGQGGGYLTTLRVSPKPCAETHPMPLPNKIPIKIFAKKLRSNPTPAEYFFWSHIRCRQVAGFKFRRQFPLGEYVVDFICLDKKLIVELDGGQHNTDESEHYDARRTKWLNEKGYRVVRFWNNDVMNNMEGVMERLFEVLSPPPQPSPSTEGEGE